jgi:hypothetical protein
MYFNDLCRDTTDSPQLESGHFCDIQLLQTSMKARNQPLRNLRKRQVIFVTAFFHRRGKVAAGGDLWSQVWGRAAL